MRLKIEVDRSLSYYSRVFVMFVMYVSGFRLNLWYQLL